MPRYAERGPAPVKAKPAAPQAAVRQQARSPRLVQRPAIARAVQLRAAGSPQVESDAASPSRAGLPGPLRAGVEALSGLAMDDVRVHRDSPEPAKLGALAYAKGSDIHLGPGQEEHLAHEAWHVVQQKQGRVSATQLKTSVPDQDDELEAEANLAASLLNEAPGVPLRAGPPATPQSAVPSGSEGLPKPAARSAAPFDRLTESDETDEYDAPESQEVEEQNLDEAGEGTPTKEKGQEPHRPNITYGGPRDHIYTLITRMLDKEFQKKFKKWDDSPDLYLIKRDKKAKNSLATANPEVKKDSHGDPHIYPDESKGHKHYDVLYNEGKEENPPKKKIKFPHVDIDFNRVKAVFKFPLDLVVDIASVLASIAMLFAALTIGGLIGLYNLVAKKKLGWGFANRVEHGDTGFNLLSWGIGDYNKYSLAGSKIEPRGKARIRPEGGALTGIIGYGGHKSVHGTRRPPAFIAIGQAIQGRKGEKKAIWRLDSPRKRRLRRRRRWRRIGRLLGF